MPIYPFGTGTLVAKRTDVANTQPFLFGVLQDLTLDFDQKLEELYGQSKFPVAIGDSTISVKGKAKFARFQQTLFNNLMIGQTAGAGMLEMVSTGETATIPGTPYQVTVANAASTPLTDYGVFYSATGIQLSPVASGPTAGQYSFNSATGVYTFAAADTTLGVYIYYTYTTASGGFKTTMTNPLMGSGPTFEVYFKNATSSSGGVKDVTFKLNACKTNKFSMPFNNQKFTVTEFDFQAFADNAGNIMTVSSSE